MQPSKRTRGSPTGLTPSQRPKRRVQRSDNARRRRLFDPETVPTLPEPVPESAAKSAFSQPKVVKNPQCSHLYPPTSEWSSTEDEVLTEFILLNTETGDEWPSKKSTKLWEGAAMFLKNKAGTKRTSKCPLVR